MKVYKIPEWLKQLIIEDFAESLDTEFTEDSFFALTDNGAKEFFGIGFKKIFPCWELIEEEKPEEEK